MHTTQIYADKRRKGTPLLTHEFELFNPVNLRSSASNKKFIFE